MVRSGRTTTPTAEATYKLEGEVAEVEQPRLIAQVMGGLPGWSRARMAITAAMIAHGRWVRRSSGPVRCPR